MATTKVTRTSAVTLLTIAVVLLLAAVFCIVASRSGWISYIQAFTWLRYIAYVGAGVLIAAVLVFALSLRAQNGGRMPAGIAVVLLALMVGSMQLNQAAPPPGPLINDITTDLADPPRFDAVLEIRPPDSNPAEYGGAEVAANQRQVHPEVQPIETELAPAQAFDRALAIANGMSWNIVAEDPATGIIEAVDTTPFFRFKDDIVVRVRAAEGGSRVDLRSHSRIGRSDLGKNAARIMEFRERFLAQAGTE